MIRLILITITLLTIISCSIQKDYYKTREIKAKGKVTNNVKNGKWKYFYENGNLYKTGKHRNGKEIGEWKIYHENGKIRQIGHFNNGKQTGEWDFFHANGVREGIGTSIEGEKDGIWKWYFNNGQIQTERNWNNGKLIEIISCYDGKGNELDKGTFANGSGTMKVYDIDGKLLDTFLYENGEYVK